MNDASVLTLPDGRKLAYMEWGDRGGFPAFYFHGTPSCRMEGAFADMAAKKHGLRLIATDRPGMGQSSFQEGRVFRDWPKDVCALADHLGIEQFSVVGHSGAGPHLFACGAFVSPARLKFIGALGPWGPVASPHIMASLNALDRFYARLSQRMPWIMRASFAPLGWCAKHSPGLFQYLLKASVPPADKQVLSDAAFARYFREVEVEAFRQGSRGGAHEACIAFREWDFDVADVKVPTHIWLGEMDSFVPRRMGEYLQRTIPNCDLHWVPGKGHFNLENWDDILAACVAHIR